MDDCFRGEMVSSAHPARPLRAESLHKAADL